MLKGGYALSDEEVATWLGSEELEFSEDDYKIFYEFGEDREQFQIFKSKTRFSDDDDYQTFADVNQLEANVLDQISKQKNITTDVLADVLKVTIPEIVAILKSLEERNIIKTISKTIGKGDNSNVIIERELVKPLGVTVGAVKPTTTEILIRYSYEWKSGFSNANKGTSRPFCVHLLDAKKMYSRSEIESMSARLGYSVWDRRGGWYTKPGTNTHSPSCRHEWKSNIVKRK
jgi:DNA-binding MarR family transcriptional regulator